jgi:hypothetical protein
LDAWWRQVLSMGAWGALSAALPSADVVDDMAACGKLMDDDVYAALEAQVAKVVLPSWT